MIDASLAQLVTDENEVFVREGDTTLLMLGSRVRAPEGVQKMLKAGTNKCQTTAKAT